MAEAVMWGDINDASTKYVSQTVGNREINNNLGKDAFLQLLLTQMRYQDPLSPMENTDSIAQLAQFSALEQMQNVSSASQKSQAFALMGKYVVGTILDETNNEYVEVAGIVEGVNMKNGEPYLLVDGKEMPLTKLEQVGQYDAGMNGLNSNIATLQAISIIGKVVQAITTDAEGNMEYIEGKVDYIKTIDGYSILVIGNKEVPASNVLTVSDSGLLLGKPVKAISNSAEISGTIEGVEIIDKEFFLKVGGEKVKVESIDSIVKALNYIEKEINTAEGKVEITGVIIKAGEPILLAGDKEYDMETVAEYNK